MLIPPDGPRSDAASWSVLTTHLKAQSLVATILLVAGGFAATASAADNATHTLIAERLAELCAPSGIAADDALPAGTTLDGIAWSDNVLYVRIDLSAAPADWDPSPQDVEEIHAYLARPFRADATFGGLAVEARRAPDASYRQLASFSANANLPAAVVPAPADELWQPGAAGTDAPIALYGPTVQAAAQPTGALSGVTVYVSAGHGWTAGSSNWYLQRPVDQVMNEDHGNIDQINYFAHYVFNAGATVVPLRPVGWQPIEVVLDQDDPGVTYTGAWTNSTYFKHYENGVTTTGVSYRFASAAAVENATARFTPTLPEDGFYPVYCFATASTNRVRQTYRIAHSGGLSEVVVNHREVGNGWVWLGDYHFEAAGPSYVEISNVSPDTGAVIADAIRWGGGLGTVEPYGPGSSSGYTRGEEAQRYWAEVELGENASGFDSGIWDLAGYSDGSDNIGTGARVAREMNQVPAGGVQVDRWKRVHLEFHTNAHDGNARGQLCLITTTGATSYQSQFAQILSDEVDADLLIADADFEHAWLDRWSATYTSAYGAISTGNNDDEFDATIVELAFHDNQIDAELLRDPRVRAAMARACVHGIIRFLNTLPGSQVPLAFAPDTPRSVACEDLGGGDVELRWYAPLADGARGDAATSYVIYQSSNGFGFGDPIVVGNVTSHTISNVPVGETQYYRIAARNAGGESMPSEVLALRRPSDGTVGDVLIVNGYDRLRRQINPVQTFAYPPAYAGDSIERQIWRQSNAFDYVIEHAEALAADDQGFATAANEAVVDARATLGDYAIVDWILGNENVADATFTTAEQDEVTAYLESGGTLFVSGSNIAYDLIAQGGGVTFLRSTLQTDYLGNDAGATTVYGASGSIFDDIGFLSFAVANGARYEVHGPDQLDARSDSAACLQYSGGSGGIAGVQYSNAVYNAIVFGFPFEALAVEAQRADVMARVVDFLRTAGGPLLFDYDNDMDVDFDDFAPFQFCMQGPGETYGDGHFCRQFDGNDDAAVDLRDLAMFQAAFTGPAAQ